MLCCVSSTDIVFLRSGHGCRKGAFLFPICSIVCDLVPESRRKTTKHVLSVADLAKLPASKLKQIYKWMIQHVHIQDMDHLMLSLDQTHLQMTPAWQSRLESANEFACNPQNQVWSCPGVAIWCSDDLMSVVSFEGSTGMVLGSS